jgi:uncharacterized protein YecT (DUF1311 family)
VISRKVHRYVDAKLLYDRVCRQLEQSPGLRHSIAHASALRVARTAWLLQRNALTGDERVGARDEERRRRAPVTLTPHTQEDAP